MLTQYFSYHGCKFQIVTYMLSILYKDGGSLWGKWTAGQVARGLKIKLITWSNIGKVNQKKKRKSKNWKFVSLTLYNWIIERFDFCEDAVWFVTSTCWVSHLCAVCEKIWQSWNSGDFFCVKLTELDCTFPFFGVEGCILQISLKAYVSVYCEPVESDC